MGDESLREERQCAQHVSRLQKTTLTTLGKTLSEQ